MMQIHVNDKAVDVNVADGQMPLLWFLRDRLQLTGTKYGCGKGLCGACTIHINGQPAKACQTPMADLNGKKITTLEGISENHRIKKSWERHRVPQCGYCQSGQVMSAVALVKLHPNPTEKQIDDAMKGNLCRCGTYCRIKKAIQDKSQ